MTDLVSHTTLEEESIPAGWSRRTLQEVAQLINGRGFKPHEWKAMGLPIIRIQNLNGSPDFNYYVGRYDPKIEVEPNQLLFAWSGSRGTSFGPHIWNGPLGVLNYHTWKVLVRETEIVPSFFFHVLKHLTKIIEDQAHGASALVHVQKWEMEKFPFEAPDDPTEQEAIAEALSDADGVVEGLERLIEKKQRIKQGAMQDLLTAKRRLPGFSGEWKTKRLGEVCRVEMGGTPSRSNEALWGKGHVWLSIADLKGKVVTKSKEQITAAGAETQKLVPKGTLVMSFKLSIGRLAFAGCDLFTNEAICAFLDLKEHSAFLYHALHRVDFSLYGKQAVKGYTLNKASLKLVEIDYPGPTEQKAIAELLDDMDAEITALETRLQKARAIKEGMMQNLLTGRIRLV